MKGKKMKFKINHLLASSIILFLILVVYILIGNFGIKDNPAQGSEHKVIRKTMLHENRVLEEIIQNLKSRWPEILGDLKMK